jgi:hypothetical protein
MDGDPDILWHNTNTGENTVWYMEGMTHTASASIPEEPDMNWQLIRAIDFNNDDMMDILWYNKSTGEGRVWLMNGIAHAGTINLTDSKGVNWRMFDFAEEQKGHRPPRSTRSGRRDRNRR